jgi:hypothetical protein
MANSLRSRARRTNCRIHVADNLAADSRNLAGLCGSDLPVAIFNQAHRDRKAAPTGNTQVEDSP